MNLSKNESASRGMCLDPLATGLSRLQSRALAPPAFLFFLVMTFVLGLLPAFKCSAETRRSGKLKGMLVTAAQTSPQHLRKFVQERANAVVLILTENDDSSRDRRAAIQRIRASGLDLYYWIEIGRNPVMAAAHPEWMASLQGHTEWRRFFPDLPLPAADEVVKNYPWVPLVYQETFEAHLQRVAALLEGQPVAQGIFLNDLQAAPSACGCGNSLCRWTPDYGPIRTATRLPADAAARFAAAVGKLMPQAKIIPVWTTECEESDGEKNEACAGVGCFAGACWKEFTAQLMPVAEQFEALAALLPYRTFGKDLPRYGPTAGWVKQALGSFSEMPPKRQGQAVAVNRLIAVLQGWDVTFEEQNAQIRQSEEAGTAGYILALARIVQSWEPRIVKVPLAKASEKTLYNN